MYEVEDTGEKAEFKFHNKSKLQGGACVTVSPPLSPLLFLLLYCSLPPSPPLPSSPPLLKVWAAGADDAVHNPPTDIIWKSTQNWGQGTKTLTYLCSKNGEVLVIN